MMCDLGRICPMFSGVQQSNEGRSGDVKDEEATKWENEKGGTQAAKKNNLGQTQSKFTDVWEEERDQGLTKNKDGRMRNDWDGEVERSGVKKERWQRRNEKENWENSKKDKRRKAGKGRKRVEIRRWQKTDIKRKTDGGTKKWKGKRESGRGIKGQKNRAKEKYKVTGIEEEKDKEKDRQKTSIKGGGINKSLNLSIYVSDQIHDGV